MNAAGDLFDNRSVSMGMMERPWCKKELNFDVPLWRCRTVHCVLSLGSGENEGWMEWAMKAVAAAKGGRRIQGTLIAIGKASMKCSGW